MLAGEITTDVLSPYNGGFIQCLLDGKLYVVKVCDSQLEESGDSDLHTKVILVNPQWIAVKEGGVWARQETHPFVINLLNLRVGKMRHSCLYLYGGDNTAVFYPEGTEIEALKLISQEELRQLGILPREAVESSVFGDS